MKWFRFFVSGLLRTTKNYVVVFSNSKNCICDYLRVLSSEIPKTEVVHITELNMHSKLEELKAMSGENVTFFLHGMDPGIFFFNISKGVGEQEPRSVNCTWWQELKECKFKKVLFHVCFGKQSIGNCNALSNVFLDWVSFKGDVIIPHSNHNRIREINKWLFQQLFQELNQRADSRTLKEAIELKYIEMAKRMTKSVSGGKIIGFNYFVTMVGFNSQNLYSKY
jgi:hypothetical protein